MFGRAKKQMSVTLIFTLLLVGCAPSISNSNITTQVKEYLENSSFHGSFGWVPFSEWFEVADVTVKDKLIKDKEMTVICNVTVSIIRKYEYRSGVMIAYDFIVGDGPGAPGEIRSSDVKFLFEKYESGWRIKKAVEVGLQKQN